MRHTNSFIDVAHPLGSIGVLLLLTVVHLAGEHYLAGQVISPNGGMLI